MFRFHPDQWRRLRLFPTGVAGCLALAAVWAVLAIAATTLARPPEGKGGGKGGGDDGGFVDVLVTFRDLPGDLIQSDGLGSYFTDKKEKTEAVIQVSSGKFNLKTGRVREVDLNYSTGYDAYDPNQEGRRDLAELYSGLQAADIRIHAEYTWDDAQQVWASQGELDLLAMQVGSSTRVGLTRGPLLAFGPDPHLSNPDPRAFLADPVSVARVDESTWIFEAGTDDVACSHKVLNGDWSSPVYIGLLHMPFQMTVTIQP